MKNSTTGLFLENMNSFKISHNTITGQIDGRSQNLLKALMAQPLPG